MLSESSSDNNQLPAFTIHKTEKSRPKTQCMLPSYQNYNLKLAISVTIVLLSTMLFTYYTLDLVTSLTNRIGFNSTHFIWYHNLVVFLTLNIACLYFFNLSDNQMVKIFCVFALISCLLSIAFISLFFIRANEISVMGKKIDKINTVIVCYSFIVETFASISIGFQIISCYGYIIKCIPKNSSHGLMISLFLSASFVGTNLYHTLDNIHIAVQIQIVMFVGAFVMLILIFLVDLLLKVPTFDNIEIEPVYMQLSTVDNSPQPFLKSRTNKWTIKPEQSTLKQRKTNCFQTSKFYNLLQFYSFFLFKTVNGGIIVIQAVVLVIQKEVLDQWLHHNFNLGMVFDGNQINLCQTVQIVIGVAPLIIIGFLYDCTMTKIQNSRILLLKMYQCACCGWFFIFPMQKLVGSNYQWIMVLFFVVLIILHSFSYIFIVLTMVTMFTGGYRMVVVAANSIIFLAGIIFGILDVFDLSILKTQWQITILVLIMINYSLMNLQVSKSKNLESLD
ncbi:Conserved_hypothetical protein [Hexamita inflata]|uniref:Uncharacterized protein n=1 Tax=Hexamita inflata TaxID=28002 RepID=A0ABP1HLI7_9EUKA